MLACVRVQCKKLKLFHTPSQVRRVCRSGGEGPPTNENPRLFRWGSMWGRGSSTELAITLVRAPPPPPRNR